MKKLLFLLVLILALQSCEKEQILTEPVSYCWRCETILDGVVLTEITVCGVRDISDFKQGLEAQATALLHKSCVTQCYKTR